MEMTHKKMARAQGPSHLAVRGGGVFEVENFRNMQAIATHKTKFDWKTKDTSDQLTLFHHHQFARSSERTGLQTIEVNA